jgi:hypothetical protein
MKKYLKEKIWKINGKTPKHQKLSLFRRPDQEFRRSTVPLSLLHIPQVNTLWQNAPATA